MKQKKQKNVEDEIYSFKANKAKNPSNKKLVNLSNNKLKKNFFLFILIFIILCQSIIIINLYFLLKSQKIKENNYNNTSYISNNNINPNVNYNAFFEQNEIKEKNISALSFSQELEIGKRYIDVCKKGLLNNNHKIITKFKKPRISVIVPVYNIEKKIKKCIRSIQNQNMSDIEIIIVDDASTDNTTEIIKEFQKEDKRIKILYNNKTMGILYSRSIGVLESKGKYITTIDGDDMFSSDYVFDMIYEETEEEYFDIISFKVFVNTRRDNSEFKEFYNSVKRDRKHPTVFQPELGIFAINNNDILFPVNTNIWSKLIKSEIYKGALTMIGRKRYSTYLIWAEDTSVFFVICNIAQSYKFVDKFGMFRFEDKTSSTGENFSNDGRVFGDIFLLEVVFDFSKNEYKKSAVDKLFEIKNRGYYTLKNEKNKIYLKSVIYKIMNCEYIEENYKIKIRKEFNDIIN